MRQEDGKWNHQTGGMMCMLVLIVMLVASMSACEFLGIGNTMSWKEEVLLHDGNKLVVKRVFHLGGEPTLESRERRALDEIVVFTLPGSNKEITWKTDFRDFKPEPNSLNLLVLDIVNGTPYIATYPAGCIAYNKWERPNPPYIFFKYDGNGWKRISLEEFPAEISKVNVIVGKPPEELKKSFYTVEQAQYENRNIHTPKYRTILRTPLKKVGREGCPEMIYDGYKWMGMGFFNKKASYEECFNECKKVMFDIKYCPCDRLFKTGAKGK